MGKHVIIVSILFLAAYAYSKEPKLVAPKKEAPMHIEVPKEDWDVMEECAETDPGIAVSRKEVRHLNCILRGHKFKTDPNLVE